MIPSQTHRPTSDAVLRGAAHRSALVVLQLLVFLVGAAPLARAAFAPSVSAPSVSAPAVCAQQEAATPVESSPFASPREVMQSFVRVFAYEASHDEADLQAAARTLHVEGPLEQRERTAKRLVLERFTQIFDRVADIEPSEFADAAEVDGKDSWSTVLTRAEPPEASIEIAFERLPGGGWLISRDTVARADELWDRVKTLEPLEKFRSKAPLTAAQFLRSHVPKRLQGGGIWLEPYQWIGLILLIVLAVIVERILTFLLRPAIRKLSAADGLPIDIELLHDFERPIGAIFLGVVFLTGLKPLGLNQGAHEALDIAASFIVACASVWAIYRLVDVVCWNLETRAAKTENRFDDMLVPLVRRTLKVVVLAIGIVFVASRLTDQIWHVLAGLSIGSLAVGFAAKDSIENLFGTFTVLLDNPFKLGDVVKMSDIEGTVEQVGFRSTRVRTFEDSLITVPNSRFIGSHVENFGARRTRRVKIALSLTYDTPPDTIEAFCEGVRELVRRHPHTAKESYHVWLGAFSAASLDVELVCLLTTLDFATFTRERHRLFLDLLRLAAEMKVAFAFPTQTIWMGKPEDLEHPDAPKTREEAIQRGRQHGGAIAEASLARFRNAPPPPVRFDPSDPDAISG